MFDTKLVTEGLSILRENFSKTLEEQLLNEKALLEEADGEHARKRKAYVSYLSSIVSRLRNGEILTESELAPGSNSSLAKDLGMTGRSWDTPLRVVSLEGLASARDSIRRDSLTTEKQLERVEKAIKMLSVYKKVEISEAAWSRMNLDRYLLNTALLAKIDADEQSKLEARESK